MFIRSIVIMFMIMSVFMISITITVIIIIVVVVIIMIMIMSIVIILNAIVQYTANILMHVQQLVRTQYTCCYLDAVTMCWWICATLCRVVLLHGFNGFSYHISCYNTTYHIT